jgi:hypothetical protein
LGGRAVCRAGYHQIQAEFVVLRVRHAPPLEPLEFMGFAGFDPSSSELFDSSSRGVQVLDDNVEVGAVLAHLGLGDALENQHESLLIRGKGVILVVSIDCDGFHSLEGAVKLDQALRILGVENNVSGQFPSFLISEKT